MRKAGISDYEAFAKDILTSIKDRPILVRGLLRRLCGDGAPALKIADWGCQCLCENPLSPTARARSAYDLIPPPGAAPSAVERNRHYDHAQVA